MTQEFLYKVMTRESWLKSQASESLLLTSLDDAFIHFATKEQVGKVQAKFFANQDSVVLKVRSSKLVGRLVLEVNPGGSTEYYHCFEGSIPLEAVVEQT